MIFPQSSSQIKWPVFCVPSHWKTSFHAGPYQHFIFCTQIWPSGCSNFTRVGLLSAKSLAISSPLFAHTCFEMCSYESLRIPSVKKHFGGRYGSFTLGTFFPILPQYSPIWRCKAQEWKLRHPAATNIMDCLVAPLTCSFLHRGSKQTNGGKRQFSFKQKQVGTKIFVEVFFRSTRTSCTTSGGPVRLSVRKKYLDIYRHICLWIITRPIKRTRWPHGIP